LPPLQAAIRTMWKCDGNFLELLPKCAFTEDVVPFGRGGSLLVNHPIIAKHILSDEGDSFYKSDSLVKSIERLGGRSIFITTGDQWASDKEKLNPAYHSIRPSLSFDTIQNVIANYRLPKHDFNLDFEMYCLTSSVIWKLMYGEDLNREIARQLFNDWTLFKKHVSSADIAAYIMNPSRIGPQPEEFEYACDRIRMQMNDALHTKLKPDTVAYHIIQAGFKGSELIDQLTVFYLAGHETTASVLTWVFYILTQQPEWKEILQEEIDEVITDGLTLDKLKLLINTKAFFQEALRLYPPSTVFPRCPKDDVTIEGHTLKKDRSILVIPYALHRNKKYWVNPDAFLPERFLPQNRGAIIPGTYIPFGNGPHICAGKHFAQMEALMVMAYLIHRYDFELPYEQKVEVVHQLTTAPKNQIRMKVKGRWKFHRPESLLRLE
jgi:cytochrome P450